jgi:hypothetical protein
MTFGTYDWGNDCVKFECLSSIERAAAKFKREEQEDDFIWLPRACPNITMQEAWDIMRQANRRHDRLTRFLDEEIGL